MNSKLLVFVAALSLCVSAHANGYAIRTVQAGESLGSIAQLYNISVSSLMEFNALTSELLHPGDTLKVPYAEATGGVAQLAPKPPPGFVTHTLEQGESLSTLADDYNLSLQALVGANPDISSLDMLPAGIEVLVPPSAGLVLTLQEGDDLATILAHYGVDPVSVVKAHQFRSPADLRPGTMIFLPGVEPTEALARLARVREEENRYVWPVHGRITSYYGRRNLGMGTSSFHSAIDVAAPTGTPIYAARTGTVVYSGWSERGYGNLIKVRHFGGAETWYAHSSKLLASVGERVEQGEVIALIGSTGLSTGPHLHFELHENGHAIDPLSYLP